MAGDQIEMPEDGAGFLVHVDDVGVGQDDLLYFFGTPEGVLREEHFLKFLLYAEVFVDGKKAGNADVRLGIDRRQGGYAFSPERIWLLTYNALDLPDDLDCHEVVLRCWFSRPRDFPVTYRKMWWDALPLQRGTERFILEKVTGFIIRGCGVVFAGFPRVQLRGPLPWQATVLFGEDVVAECYLPYMEMSKRLDLYGRRMEGFGTSELFFVTPFPDEELTLECQPIDVIPELSSSWERQRDLSAQVAERLLSGVLPAMPDPSEVPVDALTQRYASGAIVEEALRMFWEEQPALCLSYVALMIGQHLSERAGSRDFYWQLTDYLYSAIAPRVGAFSHSLAEWRIIWMLGKRLRRAYGLPPTFEEIKAARGVVVRECTQRSSQ